MPLALILSSYVAADRIGGGVQQLALASLGIDPVLVPSVLLGRSPAKGARGLAVEPAHFATMIEEAEAEGLFGRADLVITGYFALPEQAALAAEAIARVRAAAPRAVVLVDPIMGDEPKGLYVRPDVAEALAARLVPAADWITPNLWELGRLASLKVLDAPGAVEAARRVGRPALVTSVPVGEAEIGMVCCAPDGATLFAHRRQAAAPNGLGDLTAAVFGAGLAQGLAAAAAAERAARVAAEAMAASVPSGEPSVAAFGPRLVRPAAQVRIERLA